MKRRIVLILSVFPQLSETFIINKFNGLLSRGWDVHIVCSKSNLNKLNDYPSLIKVKDINNRVHTIWQVSPKAIPIFLYPLALIRCMLSNTKGFIKYFSLGFKAQKFKIFKSFYLDFPVIILKPDLIHFEFGTIAVNRSHLKQILGCKQVVSFRGYDLNFSGLEQPAYYQPVWEKADALHLLGEDLWQRAQRRGCPPDKKHVLIPPAIDLAAFSPDRKEEPANSLGSREQPLHILSVGRLEWKKGYEFALQAVRLLQDQGLYCHYRILGGGEYLEALAFARHQLCLEEVVEFLGAQPQAEVKRQMNWAHVFLHAAVSEGFGNAVLEAQSMQLPVVCSDADGLRENVHHGESGFVVHRRDPAALAEKLALLAADPVLRQRMGQAGRLRVQQHFQLEGQINAFEKLYQSLLPHN